MDFASEYVVENYADEEGEYYPRQNDADLSDDEDEEMGDDSDGDSYGYEACVMDFEDGEMQEEPPSGPTAPIPRKIATNTVQMAMKNMIDEPAEKTLPRTERVQCTGENCEVVLSHIDRPQTAGGKTWKCQFCGHTQEVEDWPDFGVHDKDILYVDQEINPNEPNPQMLEPFPLEDTMVFFVVDTSGSMSLPIKGVEEYKQSMDTISPFLREMLDQERRQNPSLDDNTLLANISRLQTVKSGLLEQLAKMPDKQKLGLIVFNTLVKVHGDCTGNCLVIAGDDCDRMKYEDLVQQGEKQPQLRPLSETRNKVEGVIKSLQEDGQTSLGPALTVAVAMAKRVPGSRIIVCTDGVSNYGLGKRGAPEVAVNEFYDKLSDDCKQDGVSISVVSFDDCGMKDRFGAIPNDTGGHIARVSSAQSKFQQALERDLSLETYATNVFIRFSVNQEMYIGTNEADMQSTECRYLGNINKNSQPFFTFSFRRPQQDPPDDPAPAPALSPSLPPHILRKALTDSPHSDQNGAGAGVKGIANGTLVKEAVPVSSDPTKDTNEANKTANDGDNNGRDLQHVVCDCSDTECDGDNDASSADKKASDGDKNASNADKKASDGDKNASSTDKKASDGDKNASSADKKASDGDKNASEAKATGEVMSDNKLKAVDKAGQSDDVEMKAKGDQVPQKEAVPFKDGEETKPVENGGGGSTTQNVEMAPSGDASGMSGEKVLPFQLEVQFKARSGHYGTRVWTSIKKVTKSEEKAQDKANLPTMISNLLSHWSTNVLDKANCAADLVRTCKIAADDCEDKKRISEPYPDGVTKLDEFRLKMRGIVKKRKLDEETAVFLRERQKGQA